MVTTKQLGDAGEMLVAAHLTLHGVPAYTVPVNWPSYDVAAELPGKPVQRISVKTRTLLAAGGIEWHDSRDFDWLAVVLLIDLTVAFITPRIFIIPYTAANDEGRLKGGFKPAWIVKLFAGFENNFKLSETPA